MDFSGTDPNECGVAVRHHPIVGDVVDMASVVNVNDEQEREALLSCAQQTVLMLVTMYDTDNEVILETQGHLCWWQLHKVAIS